MEDRRLGFAVGGAGLGIAKIKDAMIWHPWSFFIEAKHYRWRMIKILTLSESEDPKL